MLQAFLERANVNPTKIPCLQNLRGVRCISDKHPPLIDKGFYENYNIVEHMKLVGNLPAVGAIGMEAIEDRRECIELKP